MKIQSKESNIKRSLALKGRKKSSEHVRNISLAKIGSNNPQWKGGRTVRDGYVLIKMREHPSAVGGYVREHRLVMEKHIGRYLSVGEIVHHVNGITTDNRIENLILCQSAKEHIRKFHPFVNPNNSTTRRQCTMCKSVFDLNEHNFYKSEKTLLGYSYYCRPCKRGQYKKRVPLQDCKKKSKQETLLRIF